MYQIALFKGNGDAQGTAVMIAAIVELVPMVLFARMLCRARCNFWLKLSGIFCTLRLALTLLLLYRRERRWALCTLPVWGIILSLLFSACILVRYSYPFMICVPMLALLILFSNRRPA